MPNHEISRTGQTGRPAPRTGTPPALGRTIAAGLAWVLLASAGSAEPLPLGRTPSGHFTIDVQIGADGPFIFLIDTGASNTAIAQPVAETLGFQSVWEDYDDVQSLTTLFSAERFVLQDLRFGGLPPASLNSVVIPISTDQASAVAGLLGADAMPAVPYSIDFPNALLTLDAAPPRHADGMVDEHNLLIGDAGLFNGVRSVRVMIDSGSSRTIVNERLRARALSRSRGVTVNIHGVDSRLPARAEPILLRDIQMGGLCLDSVVAVQADLDIFEALGWRSVPAIVLGMDVLQHARITVDREAGVFEISGVAEENICVDERAPAANYQP